MKNFLEKYNAVQIETFDSLCKLTLDEAKKRILNMLDENMRNTKNDTWTEKNRMNKLLTDTETNTVFSLRIGGKKILRYSMYHLSTQEKLNFLSDFYTSIINNEYDVEIQEFLDKESEKSLQRKKASRERRKARLLQKKEDAKQKTIAAASQLIERNLNTMANPNLPRYAQF